MRGAMRVSSKISNKTVDMCLAVTAWKPRVIDSMTHLLGSSCSSVSSSVICVSPNDFFSRRIATVVLADSEIVLSGNADKMVVSEVVETSLTTRCDRRLVVPKRDVLH